MAHQRAQDAFAALLANVRADQLGGPTPCSEWTINDLIEHVVGGNEQVGRWAASPIEPPARPDGLVAAHQAAAAVAHEIFAAPGGMSATFKLPLGEVPGQVFIGLRTTDVLTTRGILPPPPANPPILIPSWPSSGSPPRVLGGAAVPRAGKALRGREALPA